MPLLEIKLSKKIETICSLEESTAILVEQYAAFVKAPADEVINASLEHVFGKDKEFQAYLEKTPKAPRVFFTPASGKRQQAGAEACIPSNEIASLSLSSRDPSADRLGQLWWQFGECASHMKQNAFPIRFATGKGDTPPLKGLCSGCICNRRKQGT